MTDPLRALPDAFSGKSVFVTGHTGFKGAWLALWLARLGARVTGYALPPPTEPNVFVAAGVDGVLTRHHDADIRDATRLTQAVREAAPDVIFHLAAQPLVRASYTSPRETFEVNVIGTASLLDAIRELGRSCIVVVVTSDKCYENREQVFGYRESDPMGGHDPYSASKGAAELVVASYRRSFFPIESDARHGVRLASARAGNVIGGGDWAQDRIVADMARGLSTGQAVSVRNPHAIRPWQHVLEPLGGYLLLASRMMDRDGASMADAWNFGPTSTEALTVGQLADLFMAAWGAGQWVDASTPGAPHEAHLLRLSIDKAVAVLGWSPRWSVRETVRRTAAWYRHFYGCHEQDRGPGFMRASCMEDIADYELGISASGRSE